MLDTDRHRVNPTPSRGATKSRARRSALLFAIVATLLTPPAAASAAPALDVSLQGGDSEVQTITLRSVTAGQFRLRFGDGGPGVGETGDLPFNATPEQVAAALNGLSNISSAGGAVSATRNLAGVTVQFRVQFDGGLRGTDVPELVPVDGTAPLVGTLPGKISVDTIEQAVIRRDDRLVHYSIGVRNTAPATTTATLGETLTCDSKESKWLGSPTITVEWYRNGVSIPGANDLTYTVSAADAGTAVQCVAVGTNSGGTMKFASLPAVVVDPQPAIAPPTSSSRTDYASRPGLIGGGTTDQHTCSVASMNWVEDADGDPDTAPTPLPAANYTYQWLRDGEEIAGATDSTYTPVTSGGDPDTGRLLQCRVIGTNAGGALVGISDMSVPGGFSEFPPILEAVNTPQVVDPSATSGPVTVTVELPAGAATSAHLYNPQFLGSAPNGWACVSSPPAGGDPAKVTCTRSDALDPQQSYPGIGLGVRLDPDEPGPLTLTATATGGSASAGSIADGFEIAPSLPFGLLPGSFWTELLDQNGEESVQAGAHPWATTAEVSFTSRRSTPHRADYPQYVPTAHARVVRTDVPAGLVGNALAPSALCDDPFKVIARDCPDGSVVGEARYRTGQGWATKGLVAIEPERGAAAQFAFGDVTTRGIYVLTAKLNPDGYALRVETAPLGQTPELTTVGASICSYGADFTTNAVEYVVTGCKKPGDPGAFPKPLLTNPTSCTVAPPVTRMSVDTWENLGVFSTLTTEEPLMTGCHQVPFTPSVEMSPTSQTADSASGFDASIDVPVDGFEDPEGISQSHLKKTVVKLPEGVSVNPSAATGLEGCSDAQLGLKTDSEPLCPDGSKLGTVEATTPALEETLSGVMVLRTPKSTVPQSGEMLRVALIVRNDERGLLVKLPGSATADPDTGRLVATFDDNPQLPIGHVEVKLRGGDKGVLAMPRDCGELSTEAALTPWSRPTSRDVTDTASTVDQRCGDGFSPKLSAGNSDNRARGQGGTYSFRFSREDGEQWLRGLTAKLPKGLLASVKDVPLCSNGLADAGNCPAASKIGVVDAKAGSGDPFVLEEKGEVFLTDGYKGGEYGLAVKIRPVAGPFRGEHELSPIVVRQAIHVDRTTAEVTAVSDPFPLIHHGIPLRAREVNVLVNRGGFMVNPSDCDQKQSSATLLSDEGTTAGFTDPFQVSNCGALAFKPKLTLALSGKRQVTTGKHPGIKAQVTQQGTSEAGIEKAVVRLPKSLALDVNNAQALCEFVDGTKPDLENHCPKGSIVGRARAKTPLLKDDLVGNVYFVKNVRKDPTTGNEIRTLPMIIVALRGEISVNLKGESDTTKAGKLVSTFASVPDAPITQFNLNIAGGSNGIIAVTRTRRAKINLCAGRHTAESDIDGHNGRRHDTDIRMKTPCTKQQVKNAKRAAARAAQGRD